MELLTTDELAAKLAGGDAYIRTKNGEIKGLAITTVKNPDAPEIIIVGTGPKIVANTRLFLESKKFVPVYVKQATNRWKYLGNYKADSYLQDQETISKFHRNRPVSDIDGILFLSSEDDVEVNVKSRSLPDTETKKKIELAAINEVIQYYQALGFAVTDHQQDNFGYDLLVEKKHEVLKIEVKGTSSVDQRFFLSRREKAKSADPLWRLAVVTEAFNAPKLKIFSSDEMENTFNFDALCWECFKPKT